MSFVSCRRLIVNRDGRETHWGPGSCAASAQSYNPRTVSPCGVTVARPGQGMGAKRLVPVLEQKYCRHFRVLSGPDAIVDSPLTP